MSYTYLNHECGLFKIIAHKIQWFVKALQRNQSTLNLLFQSYFPAQKFTKKKKKTIDR